MKLKFIWSAIVFVAFAALATYQTWSVVSPRYYQAELVKLLRGRSPAAIHKSLSVTPLDGRELLTASHERLISAARLVLQDDAQDSNDTKVGIELGHFVTHDPNGEPQLACDTYSRAILRFEADGIAEAGEKPIMEIDAPCRTSDDITRIEAIWIPVDKIVEQKPADRDLTFDDGVRYSFANNTRSEWATDWALTMVQLKTENDNVHVLTVNNREIRKIRQKPFIMHWR